MFVAVHVVNEGDDTEKWDRRARNVSKRPSEWSLDLYLDGTLYTLQQGHFEYEAKRRFTYVADNVEKDGAAIAAVQRHVRDRHPKKAKFSFVRDGRVPISFEGELSGSGEIYSQYGLQLGFSWGTTLGTSRRRESEEES